MRYYCTYFDHHYLPQGLVLYESLRRHGAPFRLWVLCLDQLCYDALAQVNLPDVTMVALTELEYGNEELLAAKRNRSLIEYYFTLTPAWPLYLLSRFKEIELLTYLDSDLFFFSDPAPLFDEIGPNSVGIIAHHFAPRVRWMECYGRYNVGWLTFRRDGQGMACLQWWRDRCLEWCYDRCEADRFADQKYLNQWPDLFSDVHEVRHKGANLGPWNVSNYALRAQEDRVLVDEEPLVFFHFQGFKRISRRLFDSNLAGYKVSLAEVLRDNIYEPYLRAVWGAAHSIAPILRAVSDLGENDKEVSLLGLLPLPRQRGLRRWLRVGRCVLTGTYLTLPQDLEMTLADVSSWR